MKNITEQYWNEIKPLSALVDEFNVIDGKIKVVNRTHVCMIKIESYLPDGYYKIDEIPSLKVKDTLSLNEESGDIVFNSGEITVRKAYSQEINDELSTPKLPPLKGMLKTINLNVDIVAFAAWIKKVHKLSDQMSITADTMNLVVAYESDSSSGKIELSRDFVKTMGESRSLFPMDYLYSFLRESVTKCSEYKTANIRMGTDLPLCIQSGRLVYCLAPRFEND